MTIDDRYIELVKGAVDHSLYGQVATRVERPDKLVERLIDGRLRRRGIEQFRMASYDPEFHGEGRQWPPAEFIYTMIGRVRLDNIHSCVREIIADGVPGDLIETGVWRGGACILMRALLERYSARDRRVWLADSFQGVPPPDPSRAPLDRGADFHEYEVLSCSLPDVEDAFRRFDLLDDQVRFLKGWFNDTLPTLEGHTWSLIRLDGDLYESTMTALTSLYPGLSPGGFLIVDDYNHAPCREAVHDYRREHNIVDPIETVDWTAAFWRRGPRDLSEGPH